MILECRRFDWHTGAYVPHRKEVIDENKARKIIEIWANKVIVEGFYQYSFRMDGQVLVIYTLCADILGFITRNQTEK
jgi:hypothetical protein